MLEKFFVSSKQKDSLTLSKKEVKKIINSKYEFLSFYAHGFKYNEIMSMFLYVNENTYDNFNAVFNETLFDNVSFYVNVDRSNILYSHIGAVENDCEYKNKKYLPLWISELLLSNLSIGRFKKID